MSSFLFSQKRIYSCCELFMKRNDESKVFLSTIKCIYFLLIFFYMSVFCLAQSFSFSFTHGRKTFLHTEHYKLSFLNRILYCSQEKTVDRNPQKKKSAPFTDFSSLSSAGTWEIKGGPGEADSSGNWSPACGALLLPPVTTRGEEHPSCSPPLWSRFPVAWQRCEEEKENHLCNFYAFSSLCNFSTVHPAGRSFVSSLFNLLFLRGLALHRFTISVLLLVLFTCLS